jgi:hypothetical protein
MIQAPLKTVGIDYPRPGEVIAPRQRYSLRISAPTDAMEVRVSIDDGEWKPCRVDNGFWWFDWTAPEAEGDHVAVVRVIVDDGSLLLAHPRLFKVQA